MISPSPAEKSPPMAGGAAQASAADLEATAVISPSPAGRLLPMAGCAAQASAVAIKGAAAMLPSPRIPGWRLQAEIRAY